MTRGRKVLSAIWGCISRTNNRIEDLSRKMKKSYLECAIDRYDEKFFDGGFFSCGLQYFNDRSRKDTLPIYDAQNGLIFTADIILNNRDNTVFEISNELKTNNGLSLSFLDENFGQMPLNEIPDGALAYLAWLIWREKFVDHIQGLFAIAIYDMTKKEFFLFSDHMCNRSIYYFVNDDMLLFSTLPRAVLEAMPGRLRGINEKWLIACEADNTPQMYYFPSLTPFDNVYQLTRGELLKVNFSVEKKGFTKNVVDYWNPTFKTNKDNNIDYKDIFINTFTECVKDAIDTDGDFAIALSSGLDSTSVCAIAARLLAKQNKKIYSYTSVPLPGYKSDYDSSVVVDESAGVRKMCQMYDNIVPEFAACEEKSAFTEMERLVHMFAIPVKVCSNVVWIDEIQQRARKRNCRVFLNGHFGNSTVSNGGVLGRVCEEILCGHLFEAKRQLAYYGERHGVTRKELVCGTLRQLLKGIFLILNCDRAFINSFDDRYIKKSLVHKYKIISYQRKTYLRLGYSELRSRKNVMAFVLDKAVLQNVCVYDTAFSLYYGIITRDPTKDKRIVELVGNMPPCEFADKGIERRLIRKYMTGLIPDSIRMEDRKRGRQSADMAYRLGKIGEKSINTNPKSRTYKYFDICEVKKLFDSDITKDNATDIVRIMAVDKFLKEFGYVR